ITDSLFKYQNELIPVLDLSYHEFSVDGITWRKYYTLADRYIRLSNDVKKTWTIVELARQYWSYAGDSAIMVNTDYANRILVDTITAPSNFGAWINGDISGDYYYIGEDSLTHTNMYNGGEGADG